MQFPKAKKLGGDLPLTFPKVKAQDWICDFFQSKLEAKQLKFSTLWEASRNSSSVQRLKAEREFGEKIFLLQRFRWHAQLERNRYDKKWDILAEKEQQFKEMFMKFNKFIRENQEKRERAEKKISDEIGLQHKRDNDVKQMRDEYTEVTRIKNLMEKKIKEHKMYEDYLTAIVKSTNNYRNISDVLYRYESLLETKTVLCEKQQADLSALEHAQSNLMKLIEEKSLTLVGLQNQLASLQERYELAYGKSLQWESTVNKVQDICINEAAAMHAVKCSITRNYSEMCRRKNVEPELANDDYQGKLAFIKKTLEELPKIYEKLRSLKHPKFHS